MVSAYDLTDEERYVLGRELRKRIKDDIEIKEETDPGLIAGFSIIIEDVVVDRHYRGNHIGQIIMDMALAKAKELNIKKVDLTSSPHRKAANALYLKMGFEKRNTNAYRYTIR